MNKLYSKDQIEEWASYRADDCERVCRQLLDTMRENERLLAVIEFQKATLAIARDAIPLLNPSKHTLLAVDLDSGTTFTESGVYKGEPSKTSGDK